MVKVAIVGQGYMARTHADGWAELGHADDVRWICGLGERTLFDPVSAANYTNDFDDVLADAAVNAISICTPTPSHADLAIRALRAGKNVLLEKPIALTIEDALRIEAAAAESGRTLMIAQVVRFFAGYELVRDAAKGGELGDILSVRAVRALNTPRWADWWPDETQSGGVTVDFAIHDYDQANLLLGEPATVRAVQPRSEGPIETTIEYAGGGIGQVLSFPYTPVGVPFTSSIDVVGSAGLASYRLTAGSPTETLSGADAAGELNSFRLDLAGGSSVSTVADNHPYTREIEYFVGCLEAGTAPAVSPTRSAIVALQVSLAARESIRSGGRPIDIHSPWEA